MVAGALATLRDLEIGVPMLRRFKAQMHRQGTAQTLYQTGLACRYLLVAVFDAADAGAELLLLEPAEGGFHSMLSFFWLASGLARRRARWPMGFGASEAV
jgi:hypothetical protein